MFVVSKLSKLIGVFVAAVIVLAVAVAALAIPVSWLGDVGSGEPEEIELGPLARRSLVYAADGSVLATLHGEQNREPVGLDDIPDHVVDAIIAIEDQGFWVHEGVDGRGIVRAFQANVGAGGITQGGSTITQQLVKLDLLDSSQTLERKAQEMVLAQRLEKEMSKEEILTRYLNLVYFGNGAYGVQAAAETYFGTSAEELTVDQAALLAGIIQRPAGFDPISNPTVATSRRELVLDRMVEIGALGEDEAIWYGATPLPEEVHELLPPVEDHFAEAVRRQLLVDERLAPTREERERLILQGGLRIHTTFDRRAQVQALAAREAHLDLENGMFTVGEDPATGEPRRGSAAIVSIEPSTGAVRTMVAGPDFDTAEFNVVTQGRRQTGSSFKTFVAAAIMEQGHSPTDLVDGTGPCSFQTPPGSEPWQPSNFGGAQQGLNTILGHTVVSSNCGYARLGLIAGLDEVRETAYAMGIPRTVDEAAGELGIDRSDLEDGEGAEILPSADVFALPLGVADLTPLWMASAYATFANDGVYNEPYLIERVEDDKGRVIFEHEPEPERAISAETARLVTSMLESNVQGGTGTAARIFSGQPAAGKTGTTDDSTDGWFVGYTPQLATAVWVGGLGEKFTITLGGGNITGGSYPARIWGEFMNAWQEGRDIVPFPGPPGRPGGQLLLVPEGLDLSSQVTSLQPSEPDQPGDEPEPEPEQPEVQGAAASPTTTSAPTTTAPPPPSTTSSTTTSTTEPPGDEDTE